LETNFGEKQSHQVIENTRQRPMIGQNQANEAGMRCCVGRKHGDEEGIDVGTIPRGGKADERRELYRWVDPVHYFGPEGTVTIEVCQGSG
jgi:hypothetical protein